MDKITNIDLAVCEPLICCLVTNIQCEPELICKNCSLGYFFRGSILYLRTVSAEVVGDAGGSPLLSGKKKKNQFGLGRSEVLGNLEMGQPPVIMCGLLMAGKKGNAKC